MEITKINFNIGKQSASKAEASNTFSSNPFGVSFKGNVIQADVFEKASPNIVKQISSKSKIFTSAIVGNINNWNSSLKSRMNSITSFGQKIKSNIFDAIEKAKNTEISLDFDAFADTVKNKFFPNSQYKVKNLVKMPVSDLREMLRAAIIV